MNTDKPHDGKNKRLADYSDLLKRIRDRREKIRKRVGMLSDSTKLIHEERDRRSTGHTFYNIPYGHDTHGSF